MKGGRTQVQVHIKLLLVEQPLLRAYLKWVTGEKRRLKRKRLKTQMRAGMRMTRKRRTGAMSKTQIKVKMISKDLLMARGDSMKIKWTKEEDLILEADIEDRWEQVGTLKVITWEEMEITAWDLTVRDHVTDANKSVIWQRIVHYLTLGLKVRDLPDLNTTTKGSITTEIKTQSKEVINKIEWVGKEISTLKDKIVKIIIKPEMVVEQEGVERPASSVNKLVITLESVPTNRLRMRDLKEQWIDRDQTTTVAKRTITAEVWETEEIDSIEIELEGTSLITLTIKVQGL